MARSTMGDLITQVRSRINADTADYTIGTANYWDADQIEGILDQHRADLWRHVIYPTATYNSGTIWYVEYLTNLSHFEQTDAGTAVFYIENGANSQIGTANWSVDYDRGHITFTADQKGSAYYLTARTYDLDGAAAEIWRHKAARFAEEFDFSTDNTSVSRNQKYEAAMRMAKFYEERSGGGVTMATLYRSDIDAGALS